MADCRRRSPGSFSADYSAKPKNVPWRLRVAPKLEVLFREGPLLERPAGGSLALLLEDYLAEPRGIVPGS
jgi:hypothetical protein